MPITVYADKYLYNIADYMPNEADLRLFDPAGGLPEGMDQADALLIRTVIPVNRDTLDRLPESLQFIGSATAGTDHVDLELLEKIGIAFADAAGCNARSVAEYVATALLMWADKGNIDLRKKTVGIVGVGHAGAQVEELLNAMEIGHRLYDPPREQREEQFSSAALGELLDADILTFHTPLTTSGSHPTHHWLDRSKLEQSAFDLVINTARGGVVDEKALLRACENGQVGDMVIDVWEEEPIFNDLIADKAFIRTPHIAGYARQSKSRASKMVAEALCSHFELDAPAMQLPREREQLLQNGLEEIDSLTDALAEIHPMLEYQKELSKLLGRPPQEKEAAFRKLRAEFPLRNEFRWIEVGEEVIKKYGILQKLGLNY